MTLSTRPGLLCSAVVLLGLARAVSAEVLLDTVTVGDPGNACDPQPQGCFGSVPDPYQISKFEVTNDQYAEFLNAVAATDTHALYNTSMGFGTGGITRSGTSGSFTYAVIAGRGDLPVNWVSFWDATRFANWLHNGQPTGPQDATTTEDGAYTLTPADVASNTVARNPDALVFVASEDEWYKAAYYAPGSMSYRAYPAGSNVPTTCASPGPTPNTANCGLVVFDLVAVGSYTGAPSPYGTFDQGGNVFEWSEGIVGGTDRTVRGGSFGIGSPTLAAAGRSFTPPSNEFEDVGFRVARPTPVSVPAVGPGAATALSILLAASGLVLSARPGSRRRAAAAGAETRSRRSRPRTR